jgi:hypothetical protein
MNPLRQYLPGKGILSILLLVFQWFNGLYAVDYPPPACVNYENYSLTICPPDPLPIPPLQLISYNIYINDVFYTNVPVPSPIEIMICSIDTAAVLLGENTFCVAAVYNEWITEPACETDTVAFGNPLPFYEDWSSGDLGTNGWVVNGEHWGISNNIGDPSPSLVFWGANLDAAYDETVASMVFMSDTVSFLNNYLTFEVQHEFYPGPPQQKLLVEIWDWLDNSWIEVRSIDFNANNTHEIWLPYLGTVFAIRFRVKGPDLSLIEYVAIDNISLERKCYPPKNLCLNIIYPYYRELYWTPPVGLTPGWMHWDNGVFSGTSIGTDDTIEFDVAARWEPGQLELLHSPCISQVAFVPAESAAIYTIRIWQGAGAGSLLYEDEVDNPQIGQWNNVGLSSPVPIDITQELWVGYHVSTTTGYPAGVDDGPSIDGYGNMINLGGWQTLLQINPGLDYNWNIKFLVPPWYGGTHLKYYNIYRWDYGFQLIDTTWNMDHYTDTTTIEGNLYTYKVSVVYCDETDTCISDFSNEASDWIPGVGSIPGNIPISIYPNPASDFIKINSSAIIDRIEIFNGVGGKVYTENFKEKESIIPLTSLSEGLYFIIIHSKEKTESKKVVVIK